MTTNNQVNKSNKITIDNLKVIFDEKTPEETIVLDTFSKEFDQDKIHFVIGNSGAGKTTLLTHFNGLIKSKYGNIYIGDMSILGKKKKIKNIKGLRKKVGMVFQFPEYQLFKETIEKDVMFGPMNLGATKEEAKKRTKYYLNLLGLDDSFLQRSPFNLSGGQKRRVALAGILAIEPDILIFDEPTAGLDPAGEKEMMNIILDLKKTGKTIFVITHVMDQVLLIGDEVTVIGNKKILASGTPYEIFTNEKLIHDNYLDKPKVIKVIEQLIKIDPKFSQIYDQKPKSAEELADCIYKTINSSKKKSTKKSVKKSKKGGKK